MSQAMIDVTERYRKLLNFERDHRLLQYDGAWTTAGALRDVVAALDELLTSAGLTGGAPIGLITRNRPAHVAVIATTISTSRCVVPITSIGSDTMIGNEIERTGVPVVVADEEDWSRPGLAERCTALGVLGVRLGSDGRVGVVAGATERTVDFDPLPGVAVRMPTSGTTGPPKRITYTFEHLNGALGRIAHYAPATSRTLLNEISPSNGVTIASLALAHVGGFWAVFQALAEGRSVALLDRFEPVAWANLVEEHGAKLGSLPPATIRMVLDADIPREKLATLRAVGCGTAPLDPETADAFTDKYGIPVLTAYGATEFPGGLVGWTLSDHTEYYEQKRGAAGRPRPGIRIKIIDPESGRELARGEEGILAVHSPQATTATDDGWVRTNDFARMDEDDFVWILGRADDAINRGGFKIVPQVVEAALRGHQNVIDAAVVGVPDRRLGHVPVAAVTVDRPVSPEELTAFARDQVASYQVPVEIRIVDELPRTTSLKIAKDGVRELFADRAPTG